MTETHPIAVEPGAASVPRLRRVASIALSTILVVGLLPLAAGLVRGIGSGDIGSILFYVLGVVLPANLGFMGAILTVRRPRNRIGWLLLASGVLAALTFAVGEYVHDAIAAGRLNDPFLQPAAWLGTWLFIPAIGMLVVFLPLLYPTGSLLSPRWRAVVAIGIFGIVAGTLGPAAQPGPMGPGGPDNPFVPREPFLSAIAVVSTASSLLAPPIFLLALASLLVRFRRSVGVERQQIKWFLFVAIIATLAILTSNLTSGPISDGAWILGLVTIGALPIAIGLAILRYGLYEIDRIVNRAVVYGAVTAILAGVFAAATALSQRLFISVAGQSSDASIVLTTLVVVAVYAPVRKRVEAVVDRYFKYDQRAYGPYLDELRRLLDLIEPHRAARRLAKEAMAQTGAIGVAVIGADGSVVATAGVWPSEPSAAVEIPVHDSTLSEVLVGPRRDGKPHQPIRLRELADAAAVAAAAIAAPHGADGTVIRSRSTEARTTEARTTEAPAAEAPATEARTTEG